MRVLSAVVCDEVRKEESGKLFFIGVYTETILAPRFPIKIPLVLWVHLSPPGQEKFSLEVRVKNKDKPKKTLISGRGKMTISDPAREAFIAFPKLDVPVERPMTLLFQVKVDNGRWQRAVEIGAAISSANASRQLS